MTKKKDKLASFSGLTPHCTMPYEGTRYTLVFFSRRKFNGMSDEVRTKLQEVECKILEAFRSPELFFGGAFEAVPGDSIA